MDVVCFLRDVENLAGFVLLHKKYVDSASRDFAFLLELKVVNVDRPGDFERFGAAGRLPQLEANWPWPLGPGEKALSDAMIAYWTSFARTGVPKAPGQPDWPTFASNKTYMHFTEKPEVATDLMPGMFALNEEVMQRERQAGDQAWVGNVGVAAPVLPQTKPGGNTQ